MTEIIDSPGEFESIFAGIAEQLEGMDYLETLTVCQQDIADKERESFDNQHEPNNGAWTPLAPSTVKRKGHPIILYETGALKRSLTEIGAQGNINEVRSRDSIFGTDVSYSIFHEYGTSRMPRRTHVGIDEPTVDKMADRVADETVRQLTANKG